MRALALLTLFCAACGNLEHDRICKSPPCWVPGEPSPACARYVRCWEATGGDPASVAALKPRGVCWTNTSISADSCTATCEAQILQLPRIDGGC